MGVADNRLMKAKSDPTRLISNPAFGVVAFFAVHVLLAMAMRRVGYLAAVHAVLTALLGLWYAVNDRELDRVAYMAAYVAGSEVLWRMNSAEVFWEFAKYTTAAMFLIALLRTGRLKGFAAAFLYFLLLLPSASETLMNLAPGLARRQLSFNLSGPFALMFGVWFYSNVKLSKSQLHRIFLAFMGPVAGLAGVAVSATLTSVIEFTGQSNTRTSGGFGPNQVAALLGLAAFFAFFYLLHDTTSPALKAILIASIVIFATQSAMTFSRGGLYAAAGSALLAGLFLIRANRGAARLLQIAPVLFVITVYVVVPQVVAFTGGKITDRFQKTNLTRRGDLIEADLRIWRENPVFGVGPGMAADLRGHYGEHVAAHTEFSRMLSEHGALGIAALGMLLSIAVRTFLKAKGAGGKALTVSLMVWSFLFMFANAMRLVAPSFTFGLACATVLEQKRAIRRVRKVVRVNGMGPEGNQPWEDTGPALPAF